MTELRLRDRTVTVEPGRPLVMGIVNANPDSFSDDVRVDTLDDQVQRALALERVEAHGVGERVLAGVDDPHDQRAPRLDGDGAVAQAQGDHSV